LRSAAGFSEEQSTLAGERGSAGKRDESQARSPESLAVGSSPTPGHYAPSIDAIPVNSLAFQAAGWGIRDCEYLGESEYLHESSLSAAAKRLASFFQARSTRGSGLRVIQHGNSDRSKWWVEVRASRVIGYLVIQQHAVICLHPSQDVWSSAMYVSFERGVDWLLALPDKREALIRLYDGLRTFRRLELVVDITGAECSISWNVHTR